MSDRQEISVYDILGVEHTFSFPEEIPLEIAQCVVTAYVNLELASVGWSGADGAETIHEMLRHLLEGRGFKQLFEQEVSPPTIFRDGEEVWRDESIFRREH